MNQSPKSHAPAPKRGRPRKHYESIKELCFYLGKSRATLYRMMDIGLPYVYVGSNRMFDRSKVDAWIERRTEQIQADRVAISIWREK